MQGEHHSCIAPSEDCRTLLAAFYHPPLISTSRLEETQRPNRDIPTYCAPSTAGWGTSFHFAHRWANETHGESIKRHEHYLALRLGLKPGDKVG